MSSRGRDPWVDVKTYHGLPADQVISALQKEIRRGHTENAVLLGYEMVITSPALEDYLWQRLMVISVEDIGFGDPNAAILLNALYQMVGTFDRSVGERKLFAVHAIRYLCPLGVALWPVSALGRLRLVRNHEACTGCRACDRTCPQAIAVSKTDQVRSGECTLCFDCMQVCPEQDALELQVRGLER